MSAGNRKCHYRGCAQRAVALIIDGGPCRGVASTVVDTTGELLTVIRAGPITEEQIRAAALR